MKNIVILVLLAVSFCLFSCDPTYPISITNKTTEPATIYVLENNSFYSDHIPVGSTNEGLNIYILEPNQTMDVGMAIAELENDMPISQLIIKTSSDSISAKGSEELNDLFDTKLLGGLEKPYHLTIKK